LGIGFLLIPYRFFFNITLVNKTMKEFGLTLEQTRIMFSYQYHLVLADIENENNYEIKSTKQQWLSQWKESTEIFLKGQINKANDSNSSFYLITDFKLLKELVMPLKIDAGNKLTLYLMILEVILFKPYYSLGNSSDEQFKKLKISDEEKLTNKLNRLARTLDISSDVVTRFKTNYSEAIKGIKGGLNPWLVGVLGAVALAVTAAFFTPVIAGLLAPILAPGLSGAAAVSAVLAALGGGAIAAGGLGMAGGFAVIVGGGAILGASAGVGVGALFAQSPDSALTQAAKLEVVMKEIVLIQKDIRLAQEIIKEQRQAIRSLEDEKDNLLLNKEQNKQKIENLEKAIEYLKNALKRNQDLL
jgi:tetratricopeptide (TPR) repeat protein